MCNSKNSRAMLNVTMLHMFYHVDMKGDYDMDFMAESQREACECAQITDAEKYRRLDEIIQQYKNTDGSLIQILHMAQGIFGYIPPVLQEYIADQLNIPVANVYGVITFYTHFSMVPKGRHTIKVCMGTACYVRGGKDILDALSQDLGVGVGETTSDGTYTLEVTRCIGACGLAPAVTIDDRVYQMMDANKIRGILKDMGKEA